MFNVCSAIKIRFLKIAASILFVLFPSPVFAQSTPTDLANLSLEDLLDVDVSENANKQLYERFMLNYSYRNLSVGGYKNDTDELSYDDVLFSPGEVRTAENYPVVPTFIDQHVHAISVTYMVSGTAWISVLAPYIAQSTDHISSVPGFDEFRLSSSGFGDVSINAGMQKHVAKNTVLRTSVGLHLPVGSIDEVGDTPRNGTGTLEKLPYTMQLGSGTVDLSLCFNLSRSISDFRVFLRPSAIVRTGRNKHDYRLGNNYSFVVASQYTKNRFIQPGIKIGIRHLGQIVGRDTDLTVSSPVFPYPASITDPENYGGEKIRASGTLQSCLSKSCRVSLNAELGLPIFQNLNGIQPKERYSGSIGVSFQL